MAWKKLLGLPLLFSTCLCYAFYKDRIPNGHNIPHPCIPNYRWSGVGHFNRNGGGQTNAFGQDFASHGHQWSKSLCLQDSDGDGRTNGQELGDSDCTWTQNQSRSSTVNITHPGVCEPLNNPTCKLKNTFVSCSADELKNCHVIKNPDVQSLDLRFPVFTIPPKTTNYFCMTFELPSDEDYHIVAHQPIINNSHVLHHMLLYGCETGSSANVSSDPTQCDMGSDSCFSIIGGWTVGHTGLCYGDSIGFKIGATGYNKVKLEIHYNNPNLVSNYTDTSGLRLYYRPVRPEVQDLFTLMTGQLSIIIPPGKKRELIQAVCPGYCTSLMFDRPIHVVQSLNHMHYLGRSMIIEVFRNKTSFINLTNDVHYSYDSPKTYII
ncbi:hypothetical protein Btru_067383 [Bulinus truncatus]|nr:hypothetical protein Btru_067383 [Bulinus truncatus]